MNYFFEREGNLLRADLYRILALSLHRPTRERLETLETLVRETIEMMQHDNPLAHLLGQLADACAMPTMILESEYHRLFTTDVACPAAEGSYHRAERGPIIADVAAFYRAFHLNVPERQGPPDSLKMELAFMSYMALKTNAALETDDGDRADITSTSARQFLLDHLGRWGELCATQLISATEMTFYRAVAHLLKYWLQEECRRFEIAPALLPLPLPAATDTDRWCPDALFAH